MILGVYYNVISKNQLFLHNFCHCPGQKSLSHNSRAGCEDSGPLFLEWHSCFIIRLFGRSSSLGSSLLASFSVRPLLYKGSWARGPQYSYPAICGVEPLPHEYGLHGAKDPSPFLLVTLTRNLASATHSWGEEMINSGVLSFLVSYRDPWLGAEGRNLVRLNCGGGGWKWVMAQVPQTLTVLTKI